MANFKEVLLMAETVSKEKGVDRDEVVSFIEEGLETALKKGFPEGAMVQVEIDRENGELSAWRLFQLVEQIENIEGEMLFSEIEDEEVADGYVWEKFDPTLTRQQFNIARQVALQKLKSKSKAQHLLEMLDKPIKLYSGIVRQIRKDSVLVDHGGYDLNISRKNMIMGDQFKPGDRIRFTIVEKDGQLVVTRAAKEFLMELFKEEVGQIEDGEIQIAYCARIPGYKAKVVVKTKNSKIDPVRFCIGAKGVHIKNIQQEINGEFIDILPYEYDPAQMLMRALSPVVVTKIVVDEDEKLMELAVENEDISMAIGKFGKNVELVSDLIGWNVKIYSEDQWEVRKELENEVAVALLTNGLNCDREVAEYIIESGYDTLEEIAYIPVADLVLEELDEDSIHELRKNARESLENAATILHLNYLKNLVSFGLFGAEAELLIKSGVYDIEQLGDQSIYDLKDILQDIDEERAKRLIMEARNMNISHQ